MSAASGLSDTFFALLADLGARHATDPEVFLAVWNAESDLQPGAINARSGARGLNQMMPRTLSGLGAPLAFEKLSGEAQLPWIERLIVDGERRNSGPFTTAARYYHSNFFPRTMSRGSSPAAVVVARDATDPDERAAYAANAGLDVDHDGRITLADLGAWIDRRRRGAGYAAARARLELAAGGFVRTTARTLGAAIVVPVLLGVAVLVTSWKAAR
jgi:hypothetical protein